MRSGRYHQVTGVVGVLCDLAVIEKRTTKLLEKLTLTVLFTTFLLSSTLSREMYLKTDQYHSILLALQP